MPETLPDLLVRIRAGSASAAERVRARELVVREETFPADVREIAFTSDDDAREDAAALLGLLGEPLVALRRVLEGEAAGVDIADAVLAAVGARPGLPVTDAVAAEAGPIDIAGRVMAELGLTRRDTVVAPPTALPAPVNDGRGFRIGSRGWAIVAMAAAALFAVVVGMPEAPVSDASPELVFAQAGDLVVEDLTYAEDVRVVQLEGAEGAVILWVDDGDA